MNITGTVTEQLTPKNAGSARHELQTFAVNDRSPFHDIGTVDHAARTLEVVSGLVAALSFSGDGLGSVNTRIAESAFKAMGTLIDLAAFSVRHAPAKEDRE